MDPIHVISAILFHLVIKELFPLICMFCCELVTDIGHRLVSCAPVDVGTPALAQDSAVQTNVVHLSLM